MCYSNFGDIMNNILNLNKDDIKYCTSFSSRLKGMMFQKNENKFIYCFPKCNSIHTFFMFKNIDAIICDKENNVIRIIKNLKPFRIILPIKKAYYIYECDHNLIDLNNNFKKINVG